MSQQSWITRAIRIGVGTILLLVAASMLAQRKPGDFPVYMLAAERVVQGEQIYRPLEPPAFTYPPFFVFPGVALLPLPEPWRLYAWSLLNCGLLVATVAMVIAWIEPIVRWRMLHVVNPAKDSTIKSSKRNRWMWSVIALMSARFLVSPLEYHAHDLIVLLLVLVAGRWWATDRFARAGGWIGLAAACKATPLLFLPVFAAQRKWRACAALVAILGLATLLPDLVFPSKDGQPWALSWYQNFVSKVSVAAAPEADGAWARWDILNQSLSGTLYRLGTPNKHSSHIDVCLVQLSDTQIRVATIVLEIALVGILLAAVLPRMTSRWQDSERAFVRFGQLGAVLSAMLLLSPMSSKHHFCALLVPITFCVVYLFRFRRDRVVLGGMLVVLLLGSLGAKDLIGDTIGNRLQAAGSLAFCAAACLIASSRALIRGSAERVTNVVAQTPVRPTFLSDAA